MNTNKHKIYRNRTLIYADHAEMECTNSKHPKISAYLRPIGI